MVKEIEHITNNLTLKEENELEVIVLDDVVVYSSITDALKEENLENTIDNELENENEENLEKEETISLLDRISFLNNVHYKVNGNNILVNVKFNLDNDEINSLDINYVFEEDKLICKP